MTLLEKMMEAAESVGPGETLVIEIDPSTAWVSDYNVAWAKIRGIYEDKVKVANDQTNNVITITNYYSEIVDPGISVIDTEEVESLYISPIEEIELEDLTNEEEAE